MKKIGILLSVCTAIISGVSIFANAQFVTKIDPLLFALLRNTIVALFLTGILIAGSQWSHIRNISVKNWKNLLLIGLIGGGLPFALFFTGLSQIGAVSGNLIQKTLFIWVAMLAIPFLHERVSKFQIAGYVLLFAGMFLSSGTVNILPKTGTWLVLGATILWAIEHVIAKKTLKEVSPLIVAWGRMLFGLPILALAIVLTGKMSVFGAVNVNIYQALLVSSVLLTAYVCTWYTAMSKAPVTLVSSVLVIAPVVTALISLLVLHKPVAQPQLFAYALIALGTGIVLVKPAYDDR